MKKRIHFMRNVYIVFCCVNQNSHNLMGPRTLCEHGLEHVSTRSALLLQLVYAMNIELEQSRYRNIQYILSYTVICHVTRYCILFAKHKYRIKPTDSSQHEFIYVFFAYWPILLFFLYVYDLYNALHNCLQ